MPNEFSEFVLRFAKSNNLSEQWAERVHSVFVAWINETSEPIKTELTACISELEKSSPKPGRVRKFFKAFWREFLRHLTKDPGGKSRYKWADKAFIMRNELKLDYRHIYPAVCKEATGKCLEELTEDEQRDFEAQCRSLVYCREQEVFKQKSKEPVKFLDVVKES